MKRAVLGAAVVLAAGVVLFARMAGPERPAPTRPEEPVRQAAIPVPTMSPSSADAGPCDDRKYLKAEWYFDRERVLVMESAPEERVRLTEIEGRPALEVLPIPGHFLAHSRLVVIQTPASDGKPGLFLSVETQDGPEAAREIVRKIRGN